MKPALLQLAQASIASTASGGQLRNFYIARELAKVMDVFHLGFGDEGGLRSVSSSTAVPMRLVPQPRAYSAATLVRGALGKVPATLLNFHSAAMAAALTQELANRRYDVAHLEGIEMAPYLDLIERNRNRPPLVVLDWHNIESELVTRHARHGRTIAHRLYMRRALSQLNRIERGLLDRVDLHLVTSARERDVFFERNPKARVLVLENGVDTAYFAPIVDFRNSHSGSDRIRVLFVGSMDYSANIDGVMDFVASAWPAIRHDFPELRFTIVGRNPPAQVQALAAHPGVEVTGTVADVRPYYHEAFAAVVPLRVGGGTRLKVLEAMAAGVPVISTTVGVEGLRVQPGRHFYLADSPDAFRRAIGYFKNAETWMAFASAGREVVRNSYDWQHVCAETVATYCELLAIKKPHPKPHGPRIVSIKRDTPGTAA